jgi:sarcosine oxidase subunit beta
VSNPRVIVVGAGIAGACVADHLARETDATVTVLERGTAPATETTAKSGAFVGFWGHESATCVPLLRYGIDYYRRLLTDRGPPPRVVHGGRLRLATTTAGDRAIREDFAAWFGRSPTGASQAAGDEATTGAEVARAADAATPVRGAPVQYLAGDALAETLLLPGLDTDDVTGALYSPGVAYVDDPFALAGTVMDRAVTAGATVETGVDVDGLHTSDGAVTGVEADGETFDADAVVAAAGPWNRRLLADADVTLPVRNTRGPILVLDADWHGLPALYHEESDVYTRWNRDGTTYVGHFPGGHADAERLDPVAVPDQVANSRRETCLDVLEGLCPGIGRPTVRDEWLGVRQVTPDGDPVAGETAVESLWTVAFDANGIQYGPAAGRIISASIGDGTASLPTEGVAVDRFD